MKIIVLGLVLTLIALGVYTLVLCSNEALYTHRGTYACWVCISPAIRNAPEVGHAQDVVFYSSSGDGPKSPENAVTYLTDASRETVAETLTQYFKRRGVSVNVFSSQEGGGATSAGQPFVDIFIEPGSNGNAKVTIREIF